MKNLEIRIIENGDKVVCLGGTVDIFSDGNELIYGDLGIKEFENMTK